MQIEGRAKIGLHLRGNDSAPDVDWVGAIVLGSVEFECTGRDAQCINELLVLRLLPCVHEWEWPSPRAAQ